MQDPTRASANEIFITKNYTGTGTGSGTITGTGTGTGTCTITGTGTGTGTEIKHFSDQLHRTE
eukprot:CAMPEP_0201149134 /NCGR_PEP_ID=MMETSP0851-20130426/10521_1 /ASSEMBLY_ACC=CAM_ASM_000631 /TAXON_ID=183588 /ORGANISM="Pseudo-nitzschia fraudulenta, Strain WWA7" /LENGTH=62 /DNA_ID=CAMNT_0047425493 /DNA_START=338 /DNA_END=526 /DNA_ORIENTATION=-